MVAAVVNGASTVDGEMLGKERKIEEKKEFILTNVLNAVCNFTYNVKFQSYFENISRKIICQKMLLFVRFPKFYYINEMWFLIDWSYHTGRG